MKTISALKARGRLGTILDEVSKKKEHYLIERLSKPLAVVIPVEEYEETVSKESRKVRLRKVAREIDEWREKYGGKLAGWDVVKTIRKMREERTGQILKATENDRR